MIDRMAADDHRLFDRAIERFGGVPGGGQVFLETPGAMAFVASDAGEIFGWCWGYHLLRPDGSAMVYLHRLEVARRHRRSGFGRALLYAFMSAGAQAGATRMFLTTGEANAPARALYESLGGALAEQGPTVSYWFRLTAPVRPARELDPRQTPACRALLLTGVAGVGKSTVADAVGRVLTEAGQVTAVVDTDMLAQFGPPRKVAYDELKCANLAAVWSNFRAAGARYAVVSAVIDSAAARERYVGSLAGCDVRVVRLVAAADVVRSRLRERDTGAKLEQHLKTLEEEHSRPDVTIEDFTVTNDRSPADVAAGILVRAGWINQANRSIPDHTPPPDQR